MSADTERMPPVHPGEILVEEFMIPLGLSQTGLARATGVPQSRIQGIVNRQRGITWDTAIRFAAYFGTSAEFWLHAQTGYELDAAEYSGRRQAIEREVHAEMAPA